MDKKLGGADYTDGHEMVFGNLNYSKLGEMAEDVMMSNLDFYEKTVKDIENQNHDKAEMQKATLQRHLDLKRQQLEEITNP